ncbi:Lipase chaperone LimK [Marinobacter sp. es.048]|uniref:lipase secretion chaperone n=1 Tax=Marinobacter sp. es.048 TaxID=1761795 RepID=UPI000B58955D|nr:lipase secretion chaperone [Marinobacter sp. es.048]SNC63447.1 Lipase chaperone LimK [Marinobacter sp. es.048]
MVKKPRIRLFLVLLLIIAAVGSFWLMTADPVAVGEPVASASVGEPPIPLGEERGTSGPSDLVNSASSVGIPEQLPASLAGTSVPDGWARTDRLGNLIPTPHLRQLFEYFLSALGEESLRQLVARIETALSVLDESARSQALATLGNYLEYKLAVSELEQSYGEVSGLGAVEMQRRMAEIQALRRTWLDTDTADAFFADDEAVDRFQIEKLRIASDDSLTDEQKAGALRQAESGLPEPLRKAREKTRRFADYEQMREELAGDPRALDAWRQEAFGTEAAERLARLEDEQKDWDRRWQGYSRERERLLSSGLAEPERQEALERLRASHFNEIERIRAQALDSIR